MNNDVKFFTNENVGLRDTFVNIVNEAFEDLDFLDFDIPNKGIILKADNTSGLSNLENWLDEQDLQKKLLKLPSRFRSGRQNIDKLLKVFENENFAIQNNNSTQIITDSIGVQKLSFGTIIINYMMKHRIPIIVLFSFLVILYVNRHKIAVYLKLAKRVAIVAPIITSAQDNVKVIPEDKIKTEDQFENDSHQEFLRKQEERYLKLRAESEKKNEKFEKQFLEEHKLLINQTVDMSSPTAQITQRGIIKTLELEKNKLLLQKIAINKEIPTSAFEQAELSERNKNLVDNILNVRKQLKIAQKNLTNIVYNEEITLQNGDTSAEKLFKAGE